MKISVRVRDIEWTPELRKNVERSIEFAIDRYRLQVNEVSVYLAPAGPEITTPAQDKIEALLAQ